MSDGSLSYGHIGDVLYEQTVCGSILESRAEDDNLVLGVYRKVDATILENPLRFGI